MESCQVNDCLRGHDLFTPSRKPLKVTEEPQRTKFLIHAERYCNDIQVCSNKAQYDDDPTKFHGHQVSRWLH